MDVIDVRNLDVTYMTKKRPPFQAVKDASFSIRQGEMLGLVGESGCGKSTLGTAVLRLLARPGEITGGQVFFDGKDITRLDDDQLRPLRWKEISTVFQSSMNSLNPVINIASQFEDVMREHTSMNDRQIKERTAELLRMVDIDPSFARFYAHELSGGMKQRVAIALSLALEPKFILFDEPTTGLDVVVQRQILEAIRRIQSQMGFTGLIISHDLGAIMEVADRVAVMYEGQIVDLQPAADILRNPAHPYSKVLIGSYEDLWRPMIDPAAETAIGHQVTRASTTRTSTSDMSAFAEGTVLVADNLNKHYVRQRGFQKSEVQAVKDVSFTLRKGVITALVGQSGSGKSTIGRLVTGVEKPTSGTVQFGDTRVSDLGRSQLTEYREHVQLVFQDPYAALNPAHTLLHSLSRPLINFKGMKGKAVEERVAQALEQVGLTPASRFITKYPHQLSGGQRQRVVVARALLPEPEVIVADEPTSMLDVTIRAEVLEILDKLVRENGIAMLYITHDLLSARALADELLVLTKGEVVERGNPFEVINSPQHEYTKTLLAAIPNPFEQFASVAASD